MSKVTEAKRKLEEAERKRADKEYVNYHTTFFPKGEDNSLLAVIKILLTIPLIVLIAPLALLGHIFFKEDPRHIGGYTYGGRHSYVKANKAKELEAKLKQRNQKKKRS